MKAAGIAHQRHQVSIGLRCRVLGGARSGFDAAHRRPASPRAQADQRLRDAIRTLHQQRRGSYGRPRVPAERRAQGVPGRRKRGARLLRMDGVRATKGRRGRTTTTAQPAHPGAPTLLARRLAGTAGTALTAGGAGDSTSVPSCHGWLDVAVIRDRAARWVGGWAMQSRSDQAVPHAALPLARQRRRPQPGLLHHADRGGPSAATE